MRRPYDPNFRSADIPEVNPTLIFKSSLFDTLTFELLNSYPNRVNSTELCELTLTQRFLESNKKPFVQAARNESSEYCRLIHLVFFCGFAY